MRPDDLFKMKEQPIMKYKAVIFDMDGTILDTLRDITLSVNAAMRYAHMPERSEEEVRQFVGNGARRLIERSVPEGTEATRAESVLNYYRPYYELHANDHTVPYDGIPAFLSELRKEGMLLAVASNKPDNAVKLLVRQHFPNAFHAAAGERPNLRVKPHPDLLQTVMSLLHTTPEETVYVGDSDVDIRTAENAGTDCISVAWGFRSDSFLRENGAKMIVYTAEELYRAVMG